MSESTLILDYEVVYRTKGSIEVSADVYERALSDPEYLDDCILAEAENKDFTSTEVEWQ